MDEVVCNWLWQDPRNAIKRGMAGVSSVGRDRDARLLEHLGEIGSFSPGSSSQRKVAARPKDCEFLTLSS